MENTHTNTRPVVVLTAEAARRLTRLGYGYLTLAQLAERLRLRPQGAA